MTKKKTFFAKDFTATQWDTADQKVKFAEQFKKFVESDFAWEKFPKWFYERLSMTFGHIAHYNQQGFYDTYFTCTQNKVYFLQETMKYPCYGSPEFTYSDVEKKIIDWLRDTKETVWNKYVQELAKETREAELAELARLQEKYNG